MANLLINPAARQRPRAPAAAPPEDALPTRFHRTVPSYAPTPLVELTEVAGELAVGGVWIKNEQRRFGLPAYKMLGSVWAMHEAIRRRLGEPVGALLRFPALADAVARLGDLELCTATDGNHGRGVARIAEQLGARARIFVPADMVRERLLAIEAHGAQVVLVDGGYDDAVSAAERYAAATGAWLCADTVGASGAGATFAADVVRGYHTLFAEAVAQLGAVPELVVVQCGVGALAACAVTTFASGPTAIATVEPIGSACVQASLRAGVPTAVADPFTTMAGLRARHVSTQTWPVLATGVDVAIAIDDEAAADSIRRLARHGVEAGESGAAGLAGLLHAGRDRAARDVLGLGPEARILVLNTEGATDRQSYARALAGDPGPGSRR